MGMEPHFRYCSSCRGRWPSRSLGHHWRGIVTGVAIVAGTAAALTGVGALADVTVLGLEASTLGYASAAASFIAGGADLPECIAAVAERVPVRLQDFSEVAWELPDHGLGRRISSRDCSEN